MDELNPVVVGNSWVFPDGTTLPVVSGGSDGGQEEPYDWTQDAELSDYAKQFLPGLPEEHQPIVAPHVKSWDSGYKTQVDRLKGTYEQQLSPYKQLGTPESLQQEVAIARAFANDPTGVIRRAIEGGYADRDQLRDLFEAAQEAAQQQQAATPDWRQDQEWQTMRNGMAALASWVQQQEQQRQTQAMDTSLNQTMEAIKQQAPGIDETYALSIAYAMMKDGKEVDQAAIVNQWNSLRNGILGQNRTPAAPRTMPGTGPAPSNAKKLSSMDSEQRRDFLAQALQGLANS